MSGPAAQLDHVIQAVAPRLNPAQSFALTNHLGEILQAVEDRFSTDDTDADVVEALLVETGRYCGSWLS